MNIIIYCCYHLIILFLVSFRGVFIFHILVWLILYFVDAGRFVLFHLLCSVNI